MCSVQDCTKKVVAYGLCDTHRKRLSRHGHLKSTRPDDWGKREKHPLYDTWCWMKKMGAKYSLSEDWLDFWKFVSDIGDRPGLDYRLNRIDKHGNFSNENCEWIKTKPNQSAAERARQWRKDNPALEKNNYLKQMYGITLEDYNSMLIAQNYCCAICEKKSCDDTQALSVDHCHSSGKVRGLLCNNCNRALGMMKDSIPWLRSSIQYLTQRA